MNLATVRGEWDLARRPIRLSKKDSRRGQDRPVMAFDDVDAENGSSEERERERND